jgi:16S rRNA (guanine527-N7)-methyltransferase
LNQTLRHGARRFNLTLSDAQLAAFERYSQELVAWNQQTNLTRIVEPEEITVKHFLDSLSVCLALPDLAQPWSIIDVGSGAGFPGLPLKLALPQLHLTLLESSGKKTDFLRHLVEVLRLLEVMVMTVRAEVAGHQPGHRQGYDVAVARAVAALPVLVEYTMPFVKIGGWVIVQKGQAPADEIDGAANALETLGGHLEQVLPVTVPGLDAARHLIIIHKDRPTPEKYPRRPGIPAKRPID